MCSSPPRSRTSDRLSIYVQDIDRSRQWYETLGGLRHSRTCEQERASVQAWLDIRCCYMSAADHEECLVLVEERDPEGKVTVPSGMSFFHTAFELEGNRLEDVFAFAAQSKARPASCRITGRSATTASRRSAMARPAAMSPAISMIPTTTTSSSAARWTRSRTIARATARPRVRRGRDAVTRGAWRLAPGSKSARLDEAAMTFFGEVHRPLACGHHMRKFPDIGHPIKHSGGRI